MQVWLCVILDGRLSQHAGYDSWTVSVSLFIGAYKAGGPLSGKTLVRNLNLSSVSCAKSRINTRAGVPWRLEMTCIGFDYVLDILGVRGR